MFNLTAGYRALRVNVAVDLLFFIAAATLMLATPVEMSWAFVPILVWFWWDVVKSARLVGIVRRAAVALRAEIAKNPNVWLTRNQHELSLIR